MKQQDLEKIRSKTLSELKKKSQRERSKLVDLKMQASLGKLKNVREVKLKRKDLAQILTIMREKELTQNG